MRRSDAGRAGPKKRRPARGPQGLPTAARSPQRRAPTPKPAPRPKRSKPVGVFAEPIARPPGKKPVSHRPLRKERRRARDKVRETSKKLPADTKAKIAPDIKRPNRNQRAALERVVRENVETFGLQVPGNQVALPKAKRDRLTADPRKRRALDQIVEVTQAERRGAYKPPSGEARKKRKPGIAGRAVEKAGIDDALAAVGRKVKAVAPDSGAAVRDIIEETTRPVHATAGATRAVVTNLKKQTGEGGNINVSRAFVKGLKNEERYLYSDVLKAAGVKNKIVRGVGGFVLDVAADPTTYVTLGTGVPAKAAAKGAVKAGAKDATRGLRVGLRAHVPGTDKVVHVQTSGRVSAKLAEGVKKLAGDPGRKASEKVRDVLNETVSPSTTPSFRTRAEHAAIRDAERRARAGIAIGEKRTVRRAKAYQEAVPSLAEQREIIDAIERNAIDALPAKLRPVAGELKRDFAKQLKAKRKRGVGKKFTPAGPEDAQAFFPHVLNLKTDPLPTTRTVKGRKPAVDQVRRDRRTLGVKVADKPGDYVEHLPTAVAQASKDATRNVNLADLWNTVVKTGRPFDDKAQIDFAKERVYEVTKTGPKPLETALGAPDDKAMVAALSDGKRYVILNRKSVEQVRKSLPGADRSSAGRIYDRVQGATKKFQTVYNPAYQPRNLIGDTIKAWQADTTGKSFIQSYRGLRAQRARNQFEQSAEAVTAPGKKAAKARKQLDRPIRLKGGKQSTYGKELELAERHGAIDTGQVAADIRSQLGGQVQEGKLWKLNEARENFPRFATYLNARKQGMSPDAAAKHSLTTHIDYNDLTQLERKVARRAFQFYTFFARNTRDQARVLVTRPGKMATVEKALEESSKFAGFDSYDQWVDQLEDYEQKGLPLPVKVGDKVYPIFIAPPQSDLNQLSANSTEAFNNIASRATFFKLLPELAVNYSVFFRGPVQNENAPLVPAPAGVEKLPKNIREALGVQRYPDRRQGGKMIWGWYARADYIARTFPQSNFGTSFLKPTPDSRSLNGEVALLSFLSGIKVSPDKRESTRINRLFDERQKVRDRKGQLNQLGVYVDGRPVPKEHRHLIREYERLAAREKELNRELFRLRSARGDLLSPKDPGRPPKRKKKDPADPWAGGGGGKADDDPWASPKSGGSDDNPWK